MKNSFGFILALCVLPLPSLVAQQKAEPDQSLLTAVQFRAELATGLPDDRKAAEEAVDKLRAQRNPSGLPVDADAGLAFAALDIGHRLLAARKPTAAEEFFKVVEVSMQQAVARTSDEQAREKVQFLQVLAEVQGRFLNKPDEAKRSLDAAIKLHPDDPQLQYLQRSLAARRGDRADQEQTDPKGGL